MTLSEFPEPSKKNYTPLPSANQDRGHFREDRRKYTMSEAMELTEGQRQLMRQEGYTVRTYFTTDRDDYVTGISCEVDTRGIHGEKSAQRTAAEVTRHITDVCFKNRWELKLRVSGHTFIVPQPLETIISELQKRYDY